MSNNITDLSTFAQKKEAFYKVVEEAVDNDLNKNNIDLSLSETMELVELAKLGLTLDATKEKSEQALNLLSQFLGSLLAKVNEIKRVNELEAIKVRSGLPLPESTRELPNHNHGFVCSRPAPPKPVHHPDK